MMEENFYGDDSDSNSVDIYCDLGQDEDLNYKSYKESPAQEKKISIPPDNSIPSYIDTHMLGNKSSSKISKNNFPKEHTNKESYSTNDKKLITAFEYQDEIGKEFDFYSEILATEISEKQEKNRKEKLEIEKLLHENKELKKLNESLSSEMAMVNKKNAVLKKNISALYKTAKEELNRKDDLIAELREKNDDMVFRRSGLPTPQNPALSDDPNLDFANTQQSNRTRHQLNCNSKIQAKLERKKREVVPDEWGVKTNHITNVKKDEIVNTEVSGDLKSYCKYRETGFSKTQPAKKFCPGKRPFRDFDQTFHTGSDSIENLNTDLGHGKKFEDFNGSKQVCHGRYYNKTSADIPENGNSRIQDHSPFQSNTIKWSSANYLDFDKNPSNEDVTETMRGVNVVSYSENNNINNEFLPTEKNDFPKLYRYNGYAVPLAVKKRILGCTKLSKKESL